MTRSASGSGGSVLCTTDGSIGWRGGTRCSGSTSFCSWRSPGGADDQRRWSISGLPSANRAALFRIQKEQAISAARKITQFIHEIEGSSAGPPACPGRAVAGQRLDGRRLLRQAPAIAELALWTAGGANGCVSRGRRSILSAATSTFRRRTSSRRRPASEVLLRPGLFCGAAPCSS